MGVHKKSEKRIKKEAYWKKLEKLTDDYTKALIVDGDNVSSKQISKLRFQLRSIGAVMLFGKNTLIKACLNHKMTEPAEGDEDFEERKKTWKKCDQLEKLNNLMKGNSGIIFCGDNMGEVKKMIDAEAREAPAKAGAIAPDEVWIRAGPTGLDPKQTAFFQSLQIQTKIVKAQIEILGDKKIITEGMKIEATHAALLDKLKIRPFQYKMRVKQIYDNGTIYPASILDITDDSMIAGLKSAIQNIASISLDTGFITKPAIPHMLGNAFKNLAAITFETDYSFKQAETLKNAAKNAVAATSAPAAGGAKANDAAPAQEEEEEDAMEGGLGLFGDEDY